MVFWCKSCNALIGLREPFFNWSTDRNGLCADCLKKATDISTLSPENDTAENTPLQNDTAENTPLQNDSARDASADDS